MVQNAVDANLFKPLPKSGAKAKLGWEGKRTILFVGRPSPMKGLEQLLRAMNLVLRRLSDVQLVLVGGSPKFIGRNGIPLDFLISSVVEDEFRGQDQDRRTGAQHIAPRILLRCRRVRHSLDIRSVSQDSPRGHGLWYRGRGDASRRYP